ncbi:leucine-rich repeat protein 1-like [Argentina anserina]|uniref:leucine-rich repeat protein 1-like n=1 Tax=Argentina anserina TaxID=57926 RepID=UPI0021765E45|nr:leucine-rich repeat protein 1-like [Potentilla anserina]
MISRVLLCFLFAVAIASVDCNLEGDMLYSWKTILVDSHNVLASWNQTSPTPCLWFHVTCNAESMVTRVDLGNAGLSGPLIPALANLTNLQYLELYQNKFYGSIPLELGHLKKLISMDLYRNQLSGPIPETLGHLNSLKFLRVSHNNLTGAIPSSLGNLTSLQILTLNKNSITGALPLEVIELVRFGNLSVLDVSNNLLAGTVHSTNSSGFAVTKIIQDPKAQN